MPKLGCSTRVLMIAALVVLLLFVTGFVGGAIGSSFFGAKALSFIAVPKPHIQLPPEEITHPLFSLGPLHFALTNTMLAAWLTTLVLVVLAIFAARRMRLIPRGVQSLVEAALEALLYFCTSVAGEKNGRRFFPVVGTIFLFVIVNAWFSLLPGFGSITIKGPEGELVPLLRGANTDLMVTLAVALTSFVFVEYWGLSTLGVGYLSKFFNVGNLLRGKILGLIDVFVGLLEMMSEFVRIVSFTFRLFGNMTAGEILLLIAFFLVPWVLAIPFYGLELLVGFIQALIFAGLTLVFATVAVISHGEEHK